MARRDTKSPAKWAGGLRKLVCPLVPLLPCSLLLLAGCKPVGPNYNRPGYNAPSVYKETGATTVVPPPNPTGGAWQPANPSDGMLKGKWWEFYQDPQLNRLEERIATNNVELKQGSKPIFAARDQVISAREQYVVCNEVAAREKVASYRLSPLRARHSSK